MKDYVIRSVECFILPREVYYQCLWLIRDMDRLRGLKEDAPRTSVGKESARKLDAIDKALQILPEEYREPMIRNIINKEEYPEIAHGNTWRKWKQRFIFELAVNLDLQ